MAKSTKAPIVYTTCAIRDDWSRDVVKSGKLDASIGDTLGKRLVAAGDNATKQRTLRQSFITARFIGKSALPDTDASFAKIEKLITPKREGGEQHNMTAVQKEVYAVCRVDWQRLLDKHGVKSTGANAGNNNARQTTNEDEQVVAVEPKGITTQAQLMTFLKQQAVTFDGLMRKLETAKELKGDNATIIRRMVAGFAVQAGQLKSDDTVSDELARQRDIAEKATRAA